MCAVGQSTHALGISQRAQLTCVLERGLRAAIVGKEDWCADGDSILHRHLQKPADVALGKLLQVSTLQQESRTLLAAWLAQNPG